jgi:hypothetical protein
VLRQRSLDPRTLRPSIHCRVRRGDLASPCPPGRPNVILTPHVAWLLMRQDSHPLPSAWQDGPSATASGLRSRYATYKVEVARQRSLQPMAQYRAMARCSIRIEAPLAGVGTTGIWPVADGRRLDLGAAAPDHSIVSSKGHGRFRESDAFHHDLDNRGKKPRTYGPFQTRSDV